MSDLNIIKEIEQELDIELMVVVGVTSNTNGYLRGRGNEIIGLQLDNLEIETLEKLIEPFKKLTRLRWLSLCNNKIIDLSPLSNLNGLQKLWLDNNQISDLRPLSRLTNLWILSLNHNQVIDLNPLSEIIGLWKLSLQNNKISDLSPLTRLTALRELMLQNNEIIDLRSLSGLTGLWRLSLQDNKVSDLEAFSEYKNLSNLDLAGNRIKKLPQWITDLSMKIHLNESSYGEGGIFLLDNPLESPPPEIIVRGMSTIKNYFKQIEEQDKDYLFEAKLLIVGEPGAGKTSMARKLENQKCDLPKQDETTKGIFVNKINFKIHEDDFPHLNDNRMVENRLFQVNIWDFGGQEIYKATHRFFLTNRSLYALVADNRMEDTDFNYWLHIVEMFGGNSPVLIVQNERQQRKRDLDIAAIKGRFENICGEVLTVNFMEKEGFRLPRLVQEIRQQTMKLSHVGSLVPAKWTVIRGELEHDTRHTITLQDYLKICEKHDIKDRKSAMLLSQYFNDIGVFLHFQNDAVLKNTIFLNPNWATNAVYKILDDQLLDEQQGRFTMADAELIWHEEEYEFLRDELLWLMNKFFLVYEIDESGLYIVPDKLPGKKPEYHWSESNNLCLKYDYDLFMPKGIMSQFIVEMHRFITDHDKVWKRGCLLEREGAFAEVVETYDARNVEICISGKNKRNFMTIIVDQLDRINAQYERVKVDKMIPCNCSECDGSSKPHLYEYSDLKRRIEKGRSEIECRKTYKMLNVQQLIDDVLNEKMLEKEKRGIRGRRRNKIFISYSHKNEVYLKRLQTHMRVLSHEGIELDFWDDTQVKAGFVWEQEIQKALSFARVAVMLVSVDFLASDFIMANELPPLLQAAEKDGTVILPFILSPCRFLQSPLSVFQSINDPQKPLSELSKNDREREYLKLMARVEILMRN